MKSPRSQNLSPSDALGWIDEALASLAERDQLRTLRVQDSAPGPWREIGGRRVINFGANDYLDLAGDPRLAAAVTSAAAQAGWGAGASALVSGYTPLHEQLAARLAEFKHAESALVFSSGYAANLGTIAALVDRDDAIFSDELNHASIIDGCRLSRAAVHVYPHRDLKVLEELLAATPGSRRRLIATDSVFSMDGDLAPLAELTQLAERFGAMLFVDEAHATGVFGATGAGLAEALDVVERIDVSIGTLSKALGGVGGFVAGSRVLVEWLVNRARSYVFSTALPPAACAAALAALDVVRDEPARRQALLAAAESLRAQLRAQGWDVGDSQSQIIPLVVGSEREALALANRLLDAGCFVPAIRPPSVPAGKSRLRISLSSAHTPEMLDDLVSALGSVV